MRRARLYLFLGLAVGGCSRDSAGGPLGIVAFDPHQHIASAEPLFSKKEERCATNPVFIMEATSSGNHILAKSGDASTNSAITGDRNKDDCLAIADQIRAFAPQFESEPDIPLSGAALKLDKYGIKRNEMIDSVIFVSDRKCSRYINFLKTYDGNINNSLGIASLLTAGTAPLVSGEATAKILAGVSAMFNGTRETFNNNDFSNQTIHVIAAAIEKLRQDEMKSIQNYKQCPLAYYSTANGFSDVVNYHASCSVVYGLAETAKDIERAQSPDIATMKKMLTDLVALRETAGTFAAKATTDDGAAKPAAAAAPAPAAPGKPAPVTDDTASTEETPTCPYSIAAQDKPTPAPVVPKPLPKKPMPKAKIKPA